LVGPAEPVVLAEPVMRDRPGTSLVLERPRRQLEQLGELLGGEQLIWVGGKSVGDLLQDGG
jgi:hypothetical protein